MSRAYADITRLLAESFPGLTPELQKAARFLLDNPEEVGLSSMRNVAKKAGVMPATVSRLSKSLGFLSYDELREPFRERLRRNDPGFSARLQDLQRRGTGDSMALYAELRAQELANVEKTLSDTNYPAFLDAAKAIDDCRQVYVLGLRGAFAPAFLFYYAYQLFQENCQLVDTRAGIFADQLRGINDQDCLLAISFSPYTQLTIDAVNYAAESGAAIIAVTDSAVSPAARTAGHTIVAQNRSASFYHSFTGALAVTQALITLVVARKGGDAVEIAEEAERQLSSISAYW